MGGVGGELEKRQVKFRRTRLSGLSDPPNCLGSALGPLLCAHAQHHKPEVVGDVSPPATKRLFPFLFRPPLQPSHQDPHRSAQTTHNLRLDRDWPVKPSNHPESWDSAARR
jgi:hypothetical protein